MITKKQMLQSVILCILLFTLVSSVSALKNAYHILVKVNSSGNGEIIGVRGQIEYSNPNLKGGLFSYQRVILYNSFTFRFIEIGWSKRATSSDLPTGTYATLVWGTPNDPSLTDRRYWTMNTPGTYEYRIKRVIDDANGQVFHRASVFNANGQELIGFQIARNSTFGLQSDVGDHMMVGGETAALTTSTEENMVGKHIYPYVDNYGPTYSNLQWLKLKTNGTTEWNKWKDPTPSLQQYPYSSVYRGYNSLGGVLTTCGKVDSKEWCPLNQLP